MDDQGKAGEREFRMTKRAPIETGISRGTDTVHRQFGSTHGIPSLSGVGRGRGGLPARLLSSVNLGESSLQWETGRPPPNRHSRLGDSGGSRGRSQCGPPHRQFPEYLRRRDDLSRGGGSSADRRQLLVDVFGEDFLFECVLHRFVCPLQSRRGFFDRGMSERWGSSNRNSSEDTERKETPATVSAEVVKPPVIVKKKIPVDGKKIACIFAYDREPCKPNRAIVDDSELILITLRDLGFKIDCGDEPVPKEEDGHDSDSEDSDDDFMIKHKKKHEHIKTYDDIVIVNQSPRDTVRYLSSLVKDNPEATCFLMYFILKQLNSTFRTEENKQLPIFQFWKQFKNTAIPVIILIQAYVSDEVEHYSFLLNKDGCERVIPFNVPRKANVVIGYLPHKGGREESAAKILSEELCSKYDINTVMTNVIDRMSLEEEACEISPKFGSTLIKPFYLAEGIEDIKGREPTSYSREGKYLAYAFLFSQYDNLMVSDLNAIREWNEKSLQTLKDLGVELEYCVSDGKMTKRDFESKLAEILQREELDSCACMFIILSSHGCENLKIFASDDFFELEYVWQQLASCKKLQNKPKVVVTDLCRNFYNEGKIFYEEPTYRLGYCKPIPATGLTICDVEEERIPDTVLALATTKGKMAFAEEGGSMFIDILCQMLKTMSTKDFLTILMAAIEKVVQLDEKEKQQVTFSSSLRKLLYLPEKEENKESQ